MASLRDNPTTRSRSADLLEAFENMSPEERRREIDKANAFLRENGIDTLEKFHEWARK